ncbi:MAG: class I SAM-dependent methyltransferase [Gammaproteobacteria bacterium]|nr:class I SAM-dependent methyltransferase [Gammaproteobacteria bacterium]
MMKISNPGEKTYTEHEFFEQLLSLDNKNILELGCGKADITRMIATTGINRSIIATEVDEVQHNSNLQINDLPNVSFMFAGSESIPLADSSIDVVFMFKSLHHVPLELMDKALMETRRVLKPGGLAYISEPVFEGKFNDILQLFHNEEVVREAAFAALKRAVSSEQFTLEDEIFFNTRAKFNSFDEFEQNVINVTHTDHSLSTELQQQVKSMFMLSMSDAGASFLNPVRVDLLRKGD